MQIAIDKLTKTYHGKTVLSLDSLCLESGKIHGILGPNGSGKTTLMKSVAGNQQMEGLDEAIDNIIHRKPRQSVNSKSAPEKRTLTNSKFS